AGSCTHPSPRPRLAQGRIDPVQVRLHLLGAALVDDLAAERLAGECLAIRCRRQFALDAMHALAEHDVSVLALAQGPWDAIAKLESALARLEREEQIRLVHYRTGPKPAQTNLLPYVVEVIAADKPGILYQLAEFFLHHN